MRPAKYLVGFIAVTAAVSVSSCGEAPQAATPTSDTLRYNVSAAWCEKIDYEALAKRLDGWVTNPDEKSANPDDGSLECNKLILGLAPDESGGILAITVAHSYNSVELARKMFGNPASGSAAPNIEAKVDQVAFSERGETRTVLVRDSNLKVEVRLQPMPGTTQLPVEVLEDFADHVIEVIRADPGV